MARYQSEFGRPTRRPQRQPFCVVVAQLSRLRMGVSRWMRPMRAAPRTRWRCAWRSQQLSLQCQPGADCFATLPQRPTVAAERTRTPARPHSPACDQIWHAIEITALRPMAVSMATGLVFCIAPATPSCSERATTPRSQNRVISSWNLKALPVSSNSRATRMKSPPRSILV